jgi:hypothetical protein
MPNWHANLLSLDFSSAFYRIFHECSLGILQIKGYSPEQSLYENGPAEIHLMCCTTRLIPQYVSIYIQHELSPLINRSISWRDIDQPSPEEYGSDFLCRLFDDSFNWAIENGKYRWNSSTLDAGYWSTRWRGQIGCLTYRSVGYAEDHNGHTT